MERTVTINLGSGSLHHGFPNVTVQLWKTGTSQIEQFIGSLPAAPELIESYRNWQIVYRGLCDRIPGGQRDGSLYSSDNSIPTSEITDGQLVISETGITNVSQVSFDELCQQFQDSINAWLKSDGFLPIEYRIRSRLNPCDFIRVIIETHDLELRYLPWHRWHFFEDYPNAEMALSQPVFQPPDFNPPNSTRQTVRILAVLGNSTGIDLAAEKRLLQQLQDAEVKFIVNPSRQLFNQQLWHSDGWDILFFAGHSQTQAQTGQIYINEDLTHNSLTISQLEEALKAAISKGLRLAIFNSCDGLGLAQSLGKLHIPSMIVMREPVPNRVAQEFFQHFLAGFALDQLPLYQAVQQARRKLQGLENDCPAASWLPVICQNLAVEPPTWLQLGGTPPCPYRGLFAFQEEHARFFFGRDPVTQALLAAVKQKPLVALIGASGSGKSSVISAGLVPLLRQEFAAKAGQSPQIISFRPGTNPFAALASGLVQSASITEVIAHHPSSQDGDEALLDCSMDSSTLACVERWLWQDDHGLRTLIERVNQQNVGTHLFVIADQFEELYTLCHEADRQLFLDSLLNAVRSVPTFTLILTLRADFCGHAFVYRPLSDALQDAIQILGPMNPEELQAAITKPAAQMHVRLEHGLIQKLIHAMNNQPGRLPLLEFALTQLWSKQQGGWLTHQVYDEIGGVEEALANHAEWVFARLSPDDQLRSQRILIQLVKPGTGTDDSRRIATRDDVQDENWDLVTRLASSRLVVTNRNELTGNETVEIVHEALIRHWKRLRNWMQIDGEFRIWQEQLRSTKRLWDNSDQDEGALLRGKTLVDAEHWLKARRGELSLGEQDFIQQSLILRDRDFKLQKRRQQSAIVGLTTGLVGALMLAGLAWGQWQNSARSEIKAISASSEALFASSHKLDALIEAVRARQKLYWITGADAETKAYVDSVLRQAVYGASEFNRLSLHRDEVKSVAFSPDGQTIATTGRDKTIMLWKQDGTFITALKGHSDRTWQAVFSPDGQLLASASTDKTIKLWNVAAGKTPMLIKTLVGHLDGVRSVAFSPNGQILASASDDKTVKLWTRDGRFITTLVGHSGVVNGIAFSPDGQILASASDDKTVKLWTLNGTLITTLASHTDIVNGVAFSSNGQMLASTSWDKTVKLWTLKTGAMPTLLKTLSGHSEVVFGVTFSPDSQMLATSSWDKTVKVWKADGSLIETLSGHSDRVWGITFSPDGESLASASDDKTVRFWRLKSPLLTRMTGHQGVVIGVAFSPDGETLASGSDDKTVKLWTQDGRLLATLRGHSAQVYGVAFSPDGQLVASASADNTVKLWYIRGGAPRLLIALKGHQAVVWNVAFSPDGQTLASASWDNTVKLWDLGSGSPKLRTTLQGHQAAVLGVAFSPDGTAIASSSADNTVKLWSVQPNQAPMLCKTLAGHTAQVYGVTFSPDGQTIASSSADNTIKLWKLDGTLLKTLNGHNAVAFSVAFSPDGKTLTSASWDKTIKVWKPDGTLLTTLNGYNGRFWSLALSPDGKTLAAANEDKSVVAWNQEQVLTLNPLSYACDWVKDYLKTNANVSSRDRSLCQ